MATDVDGSKSTRVATFSFRVILPPIDPRKKCIENATYQAFTIFALISYPGSQGFFYGNGVSFSLFNLIYIITLREITYGRLSKLRTFSLLKSRERKSVFEKIFNKYISHREMNVKDEPISRVYLTNVYIQRWTRVIHRNSGKKSRESLLTTSKKAVN